MRQAGEETESESEDRTEEIVIDSGVSSHMTGNQDLLYQKDRCRRKVMVANGEIVDVNVKGMLKIKLPTGRYMILRDVLLIRGMTNTLISAAKMLSKDGATLKNQVFTQDKCEIKVNQQVIAKAKFNKEKRLYFLDGKVVHVPDDTDSENEVVNMAIENLWHL